MQNTSSEADKFAPRHGHGSGGALQAHFAQIESKRESGGTEVPAMAECIASSAAVFGHTNDKFVGSWKLESAWSTTKTGERSQTSYGHNSADARDWFPNR